MSPFRDLEPRGDVKGGSPKTPPRGIPVREFRNMAQHSDKPDWFPTDSLDAVRDYFTLWLTKLEAFYDAQNAANKEALKAAFASAEKAGEKTEAALSEYKDVSNEWRKTVEGLINTLKEALALRGFNDVRTEKTEDRSRETRAWVWPMIGIGLIAIVNLILNLFHK